MILSTTQWTPAAITALIASVTAFLGAIGGIIAVLHGQTLSHNKLDEITKVVEPTSTATPIPPS